jgi:pyruvate dehydrogenase phosphatase regulatory subunit
MSLLYRTKISTGILKSKTKCVINPSGIRNHLNTPPTQARIVIAGAGVVANSVAYHLVQNGWNDIIVLEQGKIGSGTSHFGSGTLGLFKPIAQRNIIWYSIKLYQQLQDMGYDIQMRQCGSINLAQTSDRLIALKRRMAYNIPTGLHCELVSQNDLQDLHPYLRVEDLIGAVWVPEDAVADPRAICDVLAILAQQGGAKYFEHTPVDKVLTQNSTVYGVETPKGVIKCEYFVNCAGMWARELGLQCAPQVRIPAYPAQHFYATTGRLTKFIDESTPIIRDYDAYTYAREYEGGFMVGWFEQQAKPAFEDSQVPRDWLKYVKKDFKHFFTFSFGLTFPQKRLIYIFVSSAVGQSYKKNTRIIYLQNTGNSKFSRQFYSRW